jgi:hypothetical protein
MRFSLRVWMRAEAGMLQRQVCLMHFDDRPEGAGEFTFPVAKLSVMSPVFCRSIDRSIVARL